MEETDSPAQKEPALDLQEIRQIVDLMAKNDLSCFDLELGSFKIKLRRGSDVEAAKDLLSKMPMQAAAPVAMTAAVAAPSSAAEAGPAPAAAEPKGPTINSPMVGTFYPSSSPGEKTFVSVGDSVDENTVVCIIEAMKVMNEIKAEARGTIARVLAEEGKPVQYGQPLFELK
ncbi:MAG: acetyl-CoA carboxylase biotin carboxyl carrier protein [Verrucomicrobiaceae bacterium]